MKCLILFVLANLFCPALFAKNQELQIFFKERWPQSDLTIDRLLSGEILVDSEVTQIDEKTQRFIMHMSAIHKKPCYKILRKVSNFEQLPSMIDYIKEANYYADGKLLVVRAEHSLLPFPMVVHVIVDRPTKVGVYPFRFPTGIFTGLNGSAHIFNHQGRCVVYAESQWQGKDTKISAFIIELFSETLTRIAADILMRKSFI